MSVYTNTLSKFAFADAIAVNTINRMDKDDSDMALFINLQIAARNALTVWPGGTLSHNTVAKLHARLRQFTDRVGWEHTPVHIQSMVNFSLAQVVDLLENHITDSRRKYLLVAMGDALQAVYLAYSASPEDHERPECIDEGLRAAEIWNEIIGG